MTTETREVTGPRTYPSAWQWNQDGTVKLMTAEEWLEEEATVYDAISKDDDDPENDGPSRSGVMRAIAMEIANLRRTRAQWADQATRQVAEIERLKAAAR